MKKESARFSRFGGSARFPCYLLLHLAYESWKKYNVGIGTKVYPGMKVAGVGKPDYSETAYHLHVSVVVLEAVDEVFKGVESMTPPIIRDSNYCFPIWGYKDKGS